MHPSLSARWVILLSGLATVCLAPAPDVEAPHAANDIYQSLLRDGLTIAGTHISFPAPTVNDGDTPDTERAALRRLEGSDEKLEELLKPEVKPPVRVRPLDEKAADGTLIRITHVWAVVRARLDEIDPARFGGEDGKPRGAMNMMFSSRRLSDEALKERGIERDDPKLEWYSHITGDILGRIHVEVTDRSRGTKSARSWVVAGRTDPRFDDDKQYPNRWMALPQGAPAKKQAEPRRYAGGASTIRISQLAFLPGALLLEGHSAFAEPHAWFDGGPGLRVRIGQVARDQIERLQRELAQRRPQPKR